METLDKHFKSLAGPVFQKHGFASGDLLALWPEIAGSAMAKLCQPERIVWSRAKENPTGTLHLKVHPGRALDVQYAAEGLLERINQYLGYHAISSLKVTPDHRPKPAPQTPATAPQPPDFGPQLADIADPPLRDALARLGAGVAADKSRSPQGK
jgi:hypothetical protein